MSSPMIRGYCVLRGLTFVDEQFGSQGGRQLRSNLSPGFHSIVRDLTPNEWCPRECYVELMNGVAQMSGGDGSLEDVLVRAGESMAVEAHDTFLSLVMRVLTPKLFAKKLPGIWDMSHRSSGHFEVDLSTVDASRVSARLVGVAGFDHVGLAYLGWIRRGLAKIGVPAARVEQRGWTPNAPGPDTITFEIGWS